MVGRADRRRLRVPDSYGVVVVMILATYGLALAADRPWTLTALLMAQTGTVWWVLRTARARRGLRLWAAVVFTFAAVGAVAGVFSDGNARLVGLTFVAGAVLYLVAPASIVRHIAFRPAVDRETMLGALAAYLLLGMAFAFAYRCLGALQRGPFFGPAGDGTLSEDLFFSFVTLTTTGYGNLVPARNPGQTLAVLEALLGQLFLVTAVAKIVEAWRPRGWRRTDSSGPGDAG
jgi:hypothetical protein